MKKIYILFILFFSVTAAGAQELKNFTWGQCVEIANKYNQNLITAKKNLSIAEYNYYISRNGYYPSVNFKYGFSRKGNGVNENSWDAGLNASQTIYDFKTSADLGGKKAVIEQTVAQLTKSYAEVYYSIKEAFLKMCYAQENVNLLNNIYNLRLQSSEMVRLQYEGGKESKGNMLKAQAQKYSAHTDFLNAKRDLLLARRSLCEAMGTDSVSEFNVDGNLSVSEDVAAVNVDSEALKAPDVIISSADVKISEYKVDYAQGDLYPNISASASIGVSDENNPIPPADSKAWTLGVALNYPLFSGGLTNVRNTVLASKEELNQKMTEYEKAVLTAKTSLQEIEINIEKYRDSIATSKMFMEASEQRQKEANIKYLAGSMEFQTWQDIEQELVNNQISHLSSLYNYNLALAKRDKMLGNTNGEIK